MSGPLSIKTSSTKTTIPLLPVGSMHKLRLNKLEFIEPEGDSRPYPVYKFTFHLVDAAQTTDGGTVHPGFPIFVNVNLGTKEKPSEVPEWAPKNLAKIEDGLLGTGDEGNKKGKPTRPDFGPELFPSLIGKEVIAKVGIYKNKTTETEAQQVDSYTFPADLAA